VLGERQDFRNEQRGLPGDHSPRRRSASEWSTRQVFCYSCGAMSNCEGQNYVYQGDSKNRRLWGLTGQANRIL
jgi:hypothetical protein